MKTLISICLLAVGLLACNKDKNILVADPVSILKGGTWSLVKFKKENNPWVDSIGLYYRFIGDTTVSSNRYNPNCDGFYDPSNSSGLKTIGCVFLCKQSANFTFSIESISNNNMIIFYQDEIGGAIVKFKEQYTRP